MKENAPTEAVESTIGAGRNGKTEIPVKLYGREIGSQNGNSC